MTDDLPLLPEISDPVGLPATSYFPQQEPPELLPAVLPPAADIYGPPEGSGLETVPMPDLGALEVPDLEPEQPLPALPEAEGGSLPQTPMPALDEAGDMPAAVSAGLDLPEAHSPGEQLGVLIGSLGRQLEALAEKLTPKQTDQYDMSPSRLADLYDLPPLTIGR